MLLGFLVAVFHFCLTFKKMFVSLWLYCAVFWLFMGFCCNFHLCRWLFDDRHLSTTFFESFEKIVLFIFNYILLLFFIVFCCSLIFSNRTALISSFSSSLAGFCCPTRSTSPNDCLLLENSTQVSLQWDSCSKLRVCPHGVNSVRSDARRKLVNFACLSVLLGPNLMSIWLKICLFCWSIWLDEFCVNEVLVEIESSRRFGCLSCPN